MDGKATIEHLLRRISSLEEELSTGRSRMPVSQLIDFLPDPTFAIDIQGTVTIWNKAMEELTGVRSQDMLGKGDFEYTMLFYETKRPMLVDLILKPDEEIEKNYLLVHKDGNVLIAENLVTIRDTELYIWGKASLISDAEGNIIGAVETIRDISKLKKAQEEIEASEKRYRDIFENVSDFLYLHDLNGKFIESNLAMKLDEYGYTEEDFATYSIQDMIPDQFKFKFEDYLSRVIKSGNDEGIMHIQTKDGAVRIIEYRNSLVYDAQGTATAIRGSARDITEREKNVNALRESEERYRLLAENIHDVIWIVDINTLRYSYLSPSIKHLLGFTVEETMSLPVDMFFTPEAFRKLVSVLNNEIAREQRGSSFDPQRSRKFEAEQIRKDGSKIWTEISATFLRDKKGNATHIMGVTRDITDRIQAEKGRKIYEERLNRAQKMEAIGTLAGGIAHDFNNILSIIIGYTELALDSIPEQDPTHEHLQEVLKAGDRARDLVRQILTFSRQVETEPRPVRLHLIIKETLKLLRSSIPSTIEIVQDIDPSSGTVLADPTHIHQVIMNLCTNAYQSMADKGGELKVSLMPASLDQDQVQSQPALNDGPYIKLSVKDTGCGMDENILERMFDPFFTTKEIGRGTGLGLATVHGIVTNLGGEIIASSTRGKGSTFDVYLPRFVADTDEISQPAADSHRGHGEHILLVDDEEALLQIGKNMLEHLGYVVSITSSSREALEMFTTDPGRFDLVITDQVMPFMRGDQLACEMKKVRADLPVILITGYNDIIAEQDSGIDGREILIEKPFSKHTLADAVFKELQKT